MIESIYVIDSASTALILQHTYTGRPPPLALLEHYQCLLRTDPETIPPSILPVPSHIVTTPTTLFSTRSHNNALILLAPVTREVHDVVGVIELLNRICDVLQDYFGREKLSRGIVEGNFDIVEELLGEIVDCGEVMTTEPNGLRDIVLPPSLLNKLMSAAGLQGKSKQISAVLSGVIECTSRLSLTPDVTLALGPANAISAPSFHPCVRISRWSKSPGTLSFIPPDGLFTLLEYDTPDLNTVDIPIRIDAKLDETGEFEVRLTPGGKKLDEITVIIPLNATIGVMNTRPSRGEFVTTSHMLTWTIPNDKTSAGMLGAGRPGYALKGQFTGGEDVIWPSDVVVRFACQGWLASSVTIGGVRVTGTGVPDTSKGGIYKGVKGMTNVEVIVRL